MKGKLLILICLLCFSIIYSQKPVVYFSDAIKANIKTYNNASNIAFSKKDFIEGQRLFDSLVRYKLVGTEFDDFTIKSYRAKSVILNKIKKPIFLITYASWCVIAKGEIPALNKLAKEHRDDIQFIVLFWDKKSNIRNLAHLFSDDIKICYASESYNNDSRIVSLLKHTLGFPTSFLIDENKKIVSIKRIANKLKPRTTFKDALAASYLNFNKMISESLISTTFVQTRLAKN